MDSIEDDRPECWGYDGLYHPERARPSISERRTRRMKEARALGTHTDEQWRELLSDYGCCAICGAGDVPLTKDHIIPVSRGGCDCIENIQPACQPCNSSKGNRI